MKRSLKSTLSEFAFSSVLLFITTIISFCFFYLGNENTVNITILYTLALILIGLRTSGYLCGIISSIFCVFAVNFFFFFPYYKLDFSPDGYPVTFLGMLTIAFMASAATTILRKQQKALTEHANKLAEADKERFRANLLRAVSHDLRTPLTSIIGSSESYLENQKDLTQEECTELVRNIKEDSEWLLNMVENLLTITRIDNTSSNKVKKSTEVVEEVVSEAIQRLQKRIPSLKITVDMPNNFLMVPMDPTLIEQVLINLLENAYHHSGSTDPILLRITDTVNEISFSVIDNGQGISEELLENLFEGQQGDSMHNNGKGFGIGLSICKTIIEAHDGSISARNLDQGAEFTFILPKEEENSND